MTGGNGKQIFGDCWWLDTEGEAMINPSLSDQSIQAYLTSSHGRPGGSRPLANYLHTPKSIVGSSEGFRHDMAQVMLLLGAYNNLCAMSASKPICILCTKSNLNPTPPPPPNLLHLHCQLLLKPCPTNPCLLLMGCQHPTPGPVCSLPLSSCQEGIFYKISSSAS